jgi:hypothetical protein
MAQAGSRPYTIRFTLPDGSSRHEQVDNFEHERQVLQDYRQEYGTPVTLRSRSYGPTRRPGRRKKSTNNPPSRRAAKRVSKALKGYLDREKVKLPSKWKLLPVRVNPRGKVQIGLNPSDLGSGGRFAKCVESVEARGGARDPNAVCAAAGIRKYGKARMERMAQAGRKRAKKR